MDEKKLEQYSDLQYELKRIEEAMSILKEDIIQDLNKNKLDKITSPFGSFYFTYRKKFNYSDKVKQLEEKVKEQKKIEEEKGECEELQVFN